jgi:geranylgeranylglycerol-phosphate geranylgeranyltransferase
MDMKGLLELIRPINDVMSAFAVLISGVISAGWNMPLISVVAASVGTFFASAGGMVINDYFDFDIDSVNKPERPIPSGQITRKGAFFFSIILFGCALVCVVFTNIWCVIIGVPALFLIILYSWKLKRKLFIGNVAVAALSALALLYGGIATGSIQLVSILALIAFFASVSRELAKDIEDVEGDRIGGSQSVPLILGIGATAQIAGFFLMLAVAFSFLPYVAGIFDQWYVSMIIPVNLVMTYVSIQLLRKKVEHISAWQKTLKIGMYVTLGIFLISRLIT